MNLPQQIMYENALADLYAGAVSAADREILASSPLPSGIVDPYASQEADALTTMELTGEAMKVWIEEAKKAHYFTKHFVTLSKMIMNGTAVMARGLMTLHERGEDLSQAPMSIGDLISLSSYHFRKSYLGVIQTAKRHPEISERLLINQLGWCNTLMRLFRTKEKLSSKAEVRSGSTDGAALPPASAAEEPARAFGERDVQGLDAMKPLSAPGAYSAPRAFGAYSRKNAGIPALPDAAAAPAVPGADAPEDAAESAELTDPAAESADPEDNTPAPTNAGTALPERSGALLDSSAYTPGSLTEVLSRLFRPPG